MLQLPTTPVPPPIYLGALAAVPMALTDERNEADAVFRQELMRYLTLPYYRAMFEMSGYAADVAQFDRTGAVSDHLAQALGCVGNAADLAAWVKSYRHAGVTLPAVRPIGWPQGLWCGATVEAAPAW